MSQGLEGLDLLADLPERIGRYEILLPIARGGAGLVYLARSRGAGGFEREVALKLLHRHLSPGDRGERLAFELIEEAKLTVRIRHPNVVQVFDVEEGPLGVFMTMEYVEGSSLGGLLAAVKERGTQLPPEIGLRILLDALAGLDAAHDLKGEEGRPLGLVHRDFSPQNILVGVEGTSKLADFGIAKVMSRSGHTTTGTIKGKVAYMAPEQISGGMLDRRCDVWAAGVVAWQILAGQHMHAGAEDVTVMYRVVHEPAPRLRARGIDVPVELDEAIARALSRDVAARCPTAAAFARTLEATGVEVATAEEVAAYVRRILGPEIAERRARIAEILERRRASARESAPAAQVLDVPAPTRASSAPAQEAILRPPAARERGLRALGIGAALAAVSLAGFGAWRAFQPASTAAGAEISVTGIAPLAAPPAPAPRPAPAPEPVLPEPAPAPSAVEPLAAQDPGPAPLAHPSPKPTTTAPTPPATTPAKASAKRGPRKPPLAPSPYGKTP